MIERRTGTQAQRSSSAPRFLAVDFFCGAGGTTRGLIDAGGYVIAGIDKDGRCERTFLENNVNDTLDQRPASFLKYDIFRKSRDYPRGGQRLLFKELDDLIEYYRNKAKRAPLLFAILRFVPRVSLLQNCRARR
jgi:DNA (cytosine-5)-methyltransferase 1